MSDYGILSSYEGHKERRTGKIRGDFSSPYLVRCVALRNLDLLMKTDWSVICPLCC